MRKFARNASFHFEFHPGGAPKLIIAPGFAVYVLSPMVTMLLQKSCRASSEARWYQRLPSTA